MSAPAGRPVYLDYAAATPCDPRVIAVMTACLGIDGCFGNPSSRDHVYGWEAAAAVETARAQIADLAQCPPRSLTFTSGATESNNLAILGLAQALREAGDRRRTFITSPIEHKSVLEAADCLKRLGCKVVLLPPERDGTTAPTTLEHALAAASGDCFLVSLAHGNSVLGSVNDIAALSRLCREQGVFFHTDTAQSAGYEPLGLAAGDVAMATFTAEKICGPKGAGALYVRPDVRLRAQIMGGGQERGLRGGTVPTHLVAGLGEAFAIIAREGPADAKRMSALRERLISGLSALPGFQVNGSATRHLPGILSVSFADLRGERLITRIASEVACSTGSACSSANLAPSYVLTAVGLGEELALNSLRLSLGRFTTAEEIDRAVAAITQAVAA